MAKTKETLLKEAINLTKSPSIFSDKEKPQILVKLNHYTKKQLIKFININGNTQEETKVTSTVTTNDNNSTTVHTTTGHTNFQDVLTEEPEPKAKPKQAQVFECPKCDYKTRDTKIKCPRHNSQLVAWSKS